MSIEHELREAAKPINGWAKPGRADLMLRAADELSRLRKALVDIRIELIHGEGDTYERITTCKEIVERALSEREGQDG
jgi:hypothetical protein